MPLTLSSTTKRYFWALTGTGTGIALLVSLGACSAEVDSPAAAGGMAGSSVGVGGSIAGAPPLAAGTGSGGAAGSGGTGPAGGAAGAPALQPTFEGMKTVIQAGCFGGLCHDLAEHPLKLKLDDALYGTLTTYTTEHCGPLVKIGSPQESALVKLLKGPCGETERMPYGKCNQDGDEGCIPPATIAVIEQWIASGAPK